MQDVDTPLREHEPVVQGIRTAPQFLRRQIFRSKGTSIAPIFDRTTRRL